MRTYSAANRKGHLTAASGQTVTGTLVTGLQKFEPDNEKETLIYIPAGYQKTNPAPLALMLHGSGGTAKQALSLLQPYARKNNIILLAPASRAYTWDIISEKPFGADAAFIDELTTFIFKHYAIDPAALPSEAFQTELLMLSALALAMAIFSLTFLHSHLVSFTQQRQKDFQLFMFLMERKIRYYQSVQ
jgi:phospholipase/carboxylesterase